MLFCSLVAVDGSVMPGGGASENAAWEVWRRPLKRSISVTIPAANNPEITAINKTWRVESLYIKLLLSLDSESSLFSRCRHGARMPSNRTPVVWCRVERGQGEHNFKTAVAFVSRRYRLGALSPAAHGEPCFSLAGETPAVPT